MDRSVDMETGIRSYRLRTRCLIPVSSFNMFWSSSGATPTTAPRATIKIYKELLAGKERFCMPIA